MPLLFHYLVPLLIAAGWYDYYGRRIPNAITLPLAGAGMLLQTFCGAGLAQALLSLTLGGGFFFLCYLLGMMGAGDVKLMAGVSVWLDPAAAAGALVWSIGCGGLMAVAMVIGRAVRLKWLKQGGASLEAATLPYGVAIAMGTWLSFGLIR
ncbi:MAG TPA: prepilin peptidase [bacterium]|nr:prepilin peptidase [bacterium]HQG44714.1 prepilin peptidase [bacterium]HQI49613.1 prepilin peptidase [bacterium]HQJ63948.1 prepilin peptidase [bacterium]